MTYFVWNHDLSTGHELIDDDHRKLIGLINALHAAIEQKEEKNIIGKVIDNLILYSQVHFEREEEEMLRIHYSGYAEHKRQHGEFIQEVNGIKKGFDKGIPVNSTYVEKMLSDWFRKHIAQTDKKLADVLIDMK